MQTFLALLLVCLSAISYFVLALGFGVQQNTPVVHIVIGLLACAWLAGLLRDSKTRPGTLQRPTGTLQRPTGTLRRPTNRLRRAMTAASLAFGLIVVAAFSWYVLDYSTYARKGAAPSEGQTLTELVSLDLKTHDGQSARLLGEGSKATLLVLYRGFW